MSEMNELKALVLELAQRLSSLESIISSTATTSGTPLITRADEPLFKLVVLSRSVDKCICGLQATRTDKHIPTIELNLFNLKAFITNVKEALRRGKSHVTLENYKQHHKYASFNRGSWQISEDDD